MGDHLDARKSLLDQRRCAVGRAVVNFVKFAEACGGVGFRCERPEEVRGAIQNAFASSKPALVEAVVDAFEPPLPARATAKQALHFAESLARGEPNRMRIATTIFRDKLTELFEKATD